MTNFDRQEHLRKAAEKIRLKKEKEERENNEYYERITSGHRWLIFKIIVVFCTSMVLISTYEYFVDGPTEPLTEEDWQIDKDWTYRWHKVLDVQGNQFTPHFNDWDERIENTLELTYTPVFHSAKSLSYDIQMDNNTIRRHSEIRKRSSITWFPLFQIFLLIPLATFIFKRKSPWFNFARITSMVFVFPGTLMVIYFTML